MVDKRALEAAEYLRLYCQSHSDCIDCIFKNDYPEVLVFEGCKLNDPDHLPETWDIDSIQVSEENK